MQLPKLQKREARALESENLTRYLDAAHAWPGMYEILLLAAATGCRRGELLALAWPDFDPTGAATGLGWRSVLGVSLGLQRQLNDRLAVRFGYEFNENPISDADTSFNLASPLIIQHWLFVGLSCGLTAHSVLSLVYVHGFENDISGPIVTPLGPLPGTSVASQGSLDSLGAGITLKY